MSDGPRSLVRRGTSLEVMQDNTRYFNRFIRRAVCSGFVALRQEQTLSYHKRPTSASNASFPLFPTPTTTVTTTNANANATVPPTNPSAFPKSLRTFLVFNPCQHTVWPCPNPPTALSYPPPLPPSNTPSTTSRSEQLTSPSPG